MFLLIVVGPTGGGSVDPMHTIDSSMRELNAATNQAQAANTAGDQVGVLTASRRKAVATQAISIGKADIERDLKITDSLAKIATAVQPS